MTDPWQTTTVACECGHKLKLATIIITTFPRDVIHTCPKCQTPHRIQSGKFVPGERQQRKFSKNRASSSKRS